MATGCQKCFSSYRQLFWRVRKSSGIGDTPRPISLLYVVVFRSPLPFSHQFFPRQPPSAPESHSGQQWISWQRLRDTGNDCFFFFFLSLSRHIEQALAEAFRGSGPRVERRMEVGNLWDFDLIYRGKTIYDPPREWTDIDAGWNVLCKSRIRKQKGAL